MEALGVDSLTDPAGLGLLAAAKERADNGGEPVETVDPAEEVQDARDKAEREAELKRKAELELRRTKEAQELEAEKQRLLAEITRAKRSHDALFDRKDDLDKRFALSVREQTLERRRSEELRGELTGLHDRIDALQHVISVLDPYNKELSGDLDALRKMLEG